MCLLLCLGARGLAGAQTAISTLSSAPPKAAAHGSSSTTTTTTAPKHSTASHTPTHATTKHTTSKKSNKAAHSKKVTKKRGQQAIDSSRAREIQAALIREHYMQGEPTGAWDSATQAAMQKYQADQGWQSKATPDARALIKLGLGPSHDHLLNPESAMTTAPSASDAKAAPKVPPATKNLPQQ